MAETTFNPPRRPSGLAKAAMSFQAFLLQRNWAGPLSEFLMVITTTGRKSGKRFSTPIGYIRDGDSLIALSVGGASNWYKNLLKTPEATLNVKGQSRRARAEMVKDPAERQRIFELYKQHHARAFDRLFGVTVDASAEALSKALATREFVRFHLDQ